MITLESMSHNSIMSGECLQQPGNWPAPITTIRYYNQAAQRSEGMFSVRVWPSMIDSSGHSTLLQQIWASSANDADCSRSLSNTSHTWTYFSCPHSVTPVSSLLLSLVSVISWSFLLLHWWPQTSVSQPGWSAQSRATSRRSAVRESAASPASSSWFTPDINISTDTRPFT